MFMLQRLGKGTSLNNVFKDVLPNSTQLLPNNRCVRENTLSTEILESLFGRFRLMERQHRKVDFKRLVSALPMLWLRVTLATVREAFFRADCKETQKNGFESVSAALSPPAAMRPIENPIQKQLTPMPFSEVHSHVGESLRGSQIAEILLRSPSRKDGATCFIERYCS